MQGSTPSRSVCSRIRNFLDLVLFLRTLCVNLCVLHQMADFPDDVIDQEREWACPRCAASESFRHRLRLGILELELGSDGFLGGVRFEADTDSSGVGAVTCRNCSGEPFFVHLIADPVLSSMA